MYNLLCSEGKDTVRKAITTKNRNGQDMNQSGCSPTPPFLNYFSSSSQLGIVLDVKGIVHSSFDLGLRTVQDGGRAHNGPCFIIIIIVILILQLLWLPRLFEIPSGGLLEGQEKAWQSRAVFVAVGFLEAEASRCPLVSSEGKRGDEMGL